MQNDIAAREQDLQALISRVRTDKSAIKNDKGIFWTKDPLTPDLIRQHLEGGPLRGVCPIKEGQNVTRVALLDLDSHKGQTSWEDMFAVAFSLQDYLWTEYGAYGRLFRSSGGNGIHWIAIWDEPQDAYSVREMLRMAIETLGYKNGAGGIVKKEIEIFPKQDYVPTGGCGSQFILPYGGKSQPICETEWIPSITVPVKQRPEPKPKQYPKYEDAPDLQEASHALGFVDTEDYHIWVEMGMCLKDAFGDTGFDTWDAWSSTSFKYEPRGMQTKWNSFRNTGLTIATLFDKAMLAGWKKEPKERATKDITNVEEFVQKVIKSKKSEKKEFVSQSIEHIPQFCLDPLKLPGLIGDTIRWITAHSIYEQPELAMLNVLAFAAALFGRRYATPIDTRCNLYMVGVARTGAGKEHSVKMIEKLALECGLAHYLGGNSIRSDIGILASLSAHSSQLLMLDEFGMLMCAIADSKGSPHLKNVAKLITSIFGKSSSLYKPGHIKDEHAEKLTIICPNLCIYGTTTESSYLPALKRSTIESGELNRFVILSSGALKEPRRSIPRMKMDYEVTEGWSRFKPSVTESIGIISDSATICPQPTIVEWGDCEAYAADINDEQSAERKKGNIAADLWARYYENTIKIAMLFAIARHKEAPVFIRADFDIAKSIVSASIKYISSLAENNMGETPQEANYLEVLAAISEKGEISRRTIKKRFRKLKNREFDDIIHSLMEEGAIEVERDSDTGGRPQTVYKRIKDSD